MHSQFIAIGALFGLLAVALGAFGAHALRSRLAAEQLAVFQTGVQYQMYHALALIGVGVWLKMQPGRGLLTSAGWLFVVGIVLFSGSLYILTLSGQRKFGAITPLGGLAMMVGWLLVLVSAL